MDSGFLILVFLAVAVIQGIGQKRREEAKKAGRPPAGETPGQPPARVGAGAGPTPGDGARGGTSEGLIPSDVWEEILGLARGKTEGPRPQEAGRRSAEPRPDQDVPLPVPVVASAPVPIPRRKAPPAPAEQPTEVRTRPAGVRLFGQGSTEELRKAIILREVLGPPLALRDEAK